MEKPRRNDLRLWGIILLGSALVVVALVYIVGSETPPRWTGDYDREPRRETGSPKDPPQIITRIDSEENSRTERQVTENRTELAPVSAHYQGVRGRVIDSHTKLPITRATIALTRWPEKGEEAAAPQEEVRILRDVQGILRVYGLENGKYTITIKAQGYLTFTEEGLRVPQSKDSLEFKLSRGTFIEGQVVTQSGKPVANIPVFITVEVENTEDRPPARRVAQTDGQGNFLFGGLPPGRYGIRLNSMHQPYTSVEDIYLGRGGSHHQTLVMPALSTVEFEIKDMANQPLVTVGIKLYEKTGAHTFTTKTDQSGLANLTFVPPGDYTLRIYKNTYKYHVEENFKILPGSEIIRVSKILEKE